MQQAAVIAARNKPALAPELTEPRPGGRRKARSALRAAHDAMHARLARSRT